MSDLQIQTLITELIILQVLIDTNYKEKQSSAFFLTSIVFYNLKIRLRYYWNSVEVEQTVTCENFF